MDPNLPVPSKIGQKSEMCLDSSLFHCPKSPKLPSVLTYSSIQNKNILSVTQWELLLFHVLTLELFIALELTQKELSQTKMHFVLFGGSIVQDVNIPFWSNLIACLQSDVVQLGPLKPSKLI